MAQNDTAKNGNGGNLGFEADLFKTADKLRGNMEPSDYKHVALGLIFLKYISDAFEAKHIRKHSHVLTPGRYVGPAEQEDDGEPFEEKMQRLSALWREQRTAANELDAVIETNLKELGYGE